MLYVRYAILKSQTLTVWPGHHVAVPQGITHWTGVILELLDVVRQASHLGLTNCT